MAEDRVAIECRKLIGKLNETRQAMYVDVTSRHVRVTIIAVEKQ
jgi:hypothetical protein